MQRLHSSRKAAKVENRKIGLSPRARRVNEGRSEKLEVRMGFSICAICGSDSSSLCALGVLCGSDFFFPRSPRLTERWARTGCSRYSGQHAGPINTAPADHVIQEDNANRGRVSQAAGMKRTSSLALRDSRFRGGILQHIPGILIIRDNLEGDRFSGLYGLVADDAE